MKDKMHLRLLMYGIAIAALFIAWIFLFKFAVANMILLLAFLCCLATDFYALIRAGFQLLK